MFSQPPNGYLLRDLIVFNQPAHHGYLAKGFVLELPDLVLALPSVLNLLQDQLSLLLRSLDPHLRLQFGWYCDEAQTPLLKQMAEAKPEDRPAIADKLQERFHANVNLILGGQFAGGARQSRGIHPMPRPATAASGVWRRVRRR